MTVIDLIERLSRLPDFAMNMDVMIRDAEGVDHDVITSDDGFPHLNFEFTDPEDAAIWRKLGGAMI